MKERLFNYNNCNHEALIIDQPEGPDPEDRYFGDIGAAIANHVAHLTNHQRQMWEDLIIMKDGSIFRPYETISAHDNDLFNLKGKDLEKILTIFQNRSKNTTDNWEAVKEAIQEEQINRQKSEDALDSGNLLSYSDWEKFPGLEKHIDLPKTPRISFAYTGNTRQTFYDEFPEGHPDSFLINKVLSILNRPLDKDIDSSYAAWVKKQIFFSQAEEYIKEILTELVDQLKNQSIKEDPDELVKIALSKIDKEWSIRYKNEVAIRSGRDSILQLLITKESQWEEEEKRGLNVFKSVKIFGREMFLNFPKKMRSHHWNRYKRIKKKFAPQITIRGFDINRCSVSDLQKALEINKNTAKDVWFLRPLNSVTDLLNQKIITKENFSDSREVNKILDNLEKTAALSTKSKNLTYFTDEGKNLAKKQRLTNEVEDENWQVIWMYYKTLKQECIRRIHEKEV